jgi:hypothetical protein
MQLNNYAETNDLNRKIQSAKYPASAVCNMPSELNYIGRSWPSEQFSSKYTNHQIDFILAHEQKQIGPHLYVVS